ncbi:hypothetical protein NP233_g12201 [Leucocoprinus birnbaumii]|uniref:Uncharacterized protein n=1 Tax=Leucocoprinus birnbaumii TaxID=56174 RepID=A0AAD5VFE3_9AGAR|nr:hypothetical protein NP233_g12201 [Leucocoprinus birnbaumii]
MHEHTTHMIHDFVINVMRTSSTHSFSTSAIIVATSSTMSMAAFSSTKVPQSPDLDPVPQLNAQLAAPLNLAHRISSRSGELTLVQNASHLTLIESQNAAYAKMQKQLHIMTGQQQHSSSAYSLKLSLRGRMLEICSHSFSRSVRQPTQCPPCLYPQEYPISKPNLKTPAFLPSSLNHHIPPRSVSIKNKTFEYDNIEIKQESPSLPIQDVLMPSTHRVHFEDEGMQKWQREGSPGDERPKMKRHVSDTPRITHTYSSSSKSRHKKSTC